MKRRTSATTVRRSVALPSTLIGELDSVAPPELRCNLNRLVIVCLQEYISRRRGEEFEKIWPRWRKTRKCRPSVPLLPKTLPARKWTAYTVIRRGQIHFASLDPVRGREQAGRRPVLVVSNDAINRLPLVVAVVFGTDAANITHDYPVNVRVPAAESGLPHDTVFLCFQVRSLDPSRLVTPEAGTLPAHRMAEVDTALHRALDL